MAKHQELLFSVNENETFVRIGITDDDLAEGDESFVAVLSEISEAGNEMVTANVTVTIEDNDGKMENQE